MSLVIAGIALLGIIACNEKKEENQENTAIEQEAASQPEETNETSLSVSDEGVITSYSIHYTKLYEYDRNILGGANAFKRWADG